MRITDSCVTTVTVPLHAPLRHVNGCHWGHFVGTVIEGTAANILHTFGSLNAVIAIPEGPGLEVELNREKLRDYKELYKEL